MKDVMDAFKSYIAPGACAIIGMFIMRDLNELRSDVKTLLVTVEKNSTRIDYLEKKEGLASLIVPYDSGVPQMPPAPIKVKAMFRKEDTYEGSEEDLPYVASKY